MLFQLGKRVCLGKILAQETVISFFLDFFQHCLERRFDVADESKIDRGSAAYVFRVLVDLYFPYLRSWKEFRKGKIGPKHQKEIGMVDRSISAAISYQACQSYSVRIVVLQPLLTSQCV